MKLTFCAIFILASLLATAQEPRGKVPGVNVKTLDGNNFNTSELSNNGSPMIISFWATWCGPCKRELNNIAGVYANWQKETGVKLVAVSIDDERNAAKVGPYSKGQNWNYEIYLDPHSDFRKAMEVSKVPHTFIINGAGEIVWEHNSYSEGDEMKYLEVIKKLKREAPASH